MIEHEPAAPDPVRVQVPPAIASPLPAAAPHVVPDATILIAATSVENVRRLVVTKETAVAVLVGRVMVVVDATVATEGFTFRVIE